MPWILKALRDQPLSRKELLERVAELGHEQGFTVTVFPLKKALASCQQDGSIINIRQGWWALASKTASPSSVVHTKTNRVSKGGGPPPTKIGKAKVFVGHGRSDAWRRLSDYLENHLGLEVVEFNREPTAGRTTIARLSDMLNKASFAVLVMTGEDETVKGTLRPRSNVTHEAGLFQGKLGFEKAIILLEEGCEDFSNVHGLTWIGFSKEKIEQTFVDLEKTLLREEIIKRRY